MDGYAHTDSNEEDDEIMDYSSVSSYPSTFPPHTIRSNALAPSIQYLSLPYTLPALPYIEKDKKL